jgi:hypothetical protein
MDERVVSRAADRVERNTSEEINQRIEAQIRRNVLYYAEHPDEISRRLHELDAEWDIERVLQTNAASLAFFGTFLGIARSRLYLLVPFLVTGFLLQHALQGWCPPVPLLRRIGLRTMREIDRERNALKALRGDYSSLAVSGEPSMRAAAALQAASIGRS